MKQMKVTVLGGGLAGLSSAYELVKKNIPTMVLESENQVGGIASSYSKTGFTLDLGPHRFHTTEDSVLNHVKDLMGENLVIRSRFSRILLEGNFFDYPLKISNAIFTMPPFTMAQIIFDYLLIKIKNIVNPAPDDSFENWVRNRFGQKLYDIYFRVYTEKTWGLSCKKLSADWAAQRITLLSLWDTFIKTMLKAGDTPRTYVTKFYYPEQGGIGSISLEYEKLINAGCGIVKLNSKVQKIDIFDNKITSIYYAGGIEKIENDDQVFSTIPVTDLIKLISPKPPEKILAANEKLIFRSLVFVHLMLGKNHISPDHWIYLPGENFTSNRLSESKNFSIKNAPDGKTVVVFEITCQKNDDIWLMDNEELTKIALEDFAKTGFAKKEDFIDSEIHKIEHAYPIYDLEYKKNLDEVMDYLKTISNLKFFGRNGLFRYNNMDHSISMGLIAAHSITDDGFDYLSVANEQKWFG